MTGPLDGPALAVIFRGAADLLRQTGWAPVSLPSGQLDLAGAIAPATARHGADGPWSADVQARACWELLRSLAGGSPLAWNDTPGRATGDVLDLLNAAAAAVDPEPAAAPHPRPAGPPPGAAGAAPPSPELAGQAPAGADTEDGVLGEVAPTDMSAPAGTANPT